MISELVIIDKSGEIHYSKQFPDGKTAVEVDSRPLLQFVSAMGIISTTMIQAPEQSVLGTNFSKTDADRIATLSESDRLDVERSLRSHPICVVSGSTIYGVITIGYHVYIVRSSTTTTDVNFINTFLFALQDVLLYLRGAALRAGPLANSALDMEEDLATIEHLALDTISSSGLRVLSRGVQAVHIDHITRTQLDRVLGSVFELPYIKGAAIFLGHRIIHSKLDADIPFVASCRLKAHPLAPEQRASQWQIFPPSAGKASIGTTNSQSGADEFGEAVVAIRLLGDCLLVLHVDKQGYRITDILSFAHEITAVASETGVVLPRNATNLTVPQLTTCEQVIDIAVYRKGAFIRPTPIQDAANGIFARFLSMAVQSLPPSLRSAEASAGAMMPLTSVSQDRSDNQTVREGVSGNTILRQQGYAFYFSVNDDEAVAILFNDTIDTVEMENVVYELRNEMLQYLFS